MINNGLKTILLSASLSRYFSIEISIGRYIITELHLCCFTYVKTRLFNRAIRKCNLY